MTDRARRSGAPRRSTHTEGVGSYRPPVFDSPPPYLGRRLFFDQSDSGAVDWRPSARHRWLCSSAVRDERELGSTGACVRRVFARVDLESSWLSEVAADSSKNRVVQVSGNPDNLNLHVSISAEDSNGRRIEAEGPDFGMSDQRRGIWHRWHGPPLPNDPQEADRLVIREHRVDVHDIEDGINQMLGRDPTLHHPLRLSWGQLINALNDAGIGVTERDLITAPLTVELAPEVQAELDRS
jgi:hypothetical protein